MFHPVNIIGAHARANKIYAKWKFDILIFD